MLGTGRLLCISTTVSGCGAPTLSFARRLQELEGTPGCPLSGPDYALLRERLRHYRSLQNTYAVKQSDIERARRAAHYSGLEFTSKPPRKSVSPSEAPARQE
ncbi:hypothetical protein TRVL_01801 [Trypanosoma vivax]|uniref:Uncharacterized protein n=1 Tax=Trypanosoma vivax (strain Y486) TaxID=1055687 RepID=G0U4H4_TRYVY|nr:hypothetical protein TRVL_01801 [Trypanosoma vivax]CCC52338.1 conserved hypothetical protein [Trypanosoma vivax Y486]